jgi:hypothetical protein
MRQERESGFRSQEPVNQRTPRFLVKPSDRLLRVRLMGPPLEARAYEAPDNDADFNSDFWLLTSDF